MNLSDPRLLGPGVLEHDLTIDSVPGYLWTSDEPDLARPAPLVLLGHPGGLDRMTPRLRDRAAHCVRAGLAAAAVELPGSGSRPPIPELEAARRELQAAIRAGRPVPGGVVDDLVLGLADRAVPELSRAAEVLLEVPGISGPIAITGGNVGVAVRFAARDERVAAAILFAGSLVPRALLEDAELLTAPVLMLLQWDDEHNDRAASLELFDRIGSAEKTLHANTGGHLGVPSWELGAGDAFLSRHLLGGD